LSHLEELSSSTVFLQKSSYRDNISLGCRSSTWRFYKWSFYSHKKDAQMAIADIEKNCSTANLVDKLHDLQDGLSAEERQIFRAIIESAAAHAEVLQANDEGSIEMAQAKPKEVPHNAKIKEELVNLPRRLFA